MPEIHSGGFHADQASIPSWFIPRGGRLPGVVEKTGCRLQSHRVQIDSMAPAKQAFGTIQDRPGDHGRRSSQVTNSPLI